MLKIGVLGTGYLGKIHMQVLSELPELFQSIHFFDPDIKAAKEAAAPATADTAQLKVEAPVSKPIAKN